MKNKHSDLLFRQKVCLTQLRFNGEIDFYFSTYSKKNIHRNIILRRQIILKILFRSDR